MKSMAEGRRIKSLLENRSTGELEHLARKRPALKEIIEEILRERWTTVGGNYDKPLQFMQ